MLTGSPQEGIGSPMASSHYLRYNHLDTTSWEICVVDRMLPPI